MTMRVATAEHAEAVLTHAAPHAPGHSVMQIVSDNFEIVVVFGFTGVIALAAIVFGILKSILDTRERERTKRELAAYIAEGTMTPDDAERILHRRGRASSE